MLSCKENNYKPVPYSVIERMVDYINYSYAKDGKVDFEQVDPKGKLKGFEGYIGPNGEFYKVSKIYVHHPSHETWALDYIHDYLEEYKIDFKKHMFELSKYADSAGLLVHRYGYVSFTHSQYGNRKPGFIFPFDNVNNLNYKQKNTFKLLLMLNDYDYYNEFMNNYNGHSYLNGKELNRAKEFRKHRMKGFRR